jgi:hypothetical protein
MIENLRLKYGNVELEIQDGYTIDKSSHNVAYSDIVCGWNEDITEFPERYQEVQIVNIDNNKVKEYGYIDSFDFGEMRETDVERDINISLMTPMKLTTLRTIIANGTYNLIELLQNIILTPLIYDGFEIAKIDITDHQVTVNFTCETIEYCMNNLSNKFNFWWFIDENKKIYITDVEILKNNEPAYTYNNDNRIPRTRIY